MKQVDSPLNFYHVGDFGFEYNSTFRLSFLNVNSHDLIYLLMNEDEYETYPIQKFPVSDVCTNNIRFPSRKVKVALSSTYEGVITEPGVYHQIVINCNDPETIELLTSVTIEQHFQNPSTHMDIRWWGIRRAKTIVIIISSALFLMWVINWPWCGKSRVHIMITLMFGMVLVGHIIRYSELKRLDVDDFQYGLTIFRMVWWVVLKLVGAITLVLAVRLYCLTSDFTQNRDILYPIALATISIMLFTLVKECDLGPFHIAIVMMYLFSGVTYVRYLVVTLRTNMTRAWLHLLAIANAGIDPRSTPVYLQHQKFKFMRAVIISYTCLFLSKQCIMMFVSFRFWISESIDDAMMLMFLASLGLIWSNMDMSEQYYVVETETTLDFESDLEILDFTSVELPPGGTTWKCGMALPPEPLVSLV